MIIHHVIYDVYLLEVQREINAFLKTGISSSAVINVQLESNGILARGYNVHIFYDANRSQ